MTWLGMGKGGRDEGPAGKTIKGDERVMRMCTRGDECQLYCTVICRTYNRPLRRFS